MEWNIACQGLRERMFALADCQWVGKVACRQGEALRLQMDGDTLLVEAPDMSGVARGLYQAALALKAGKPVPELNQKRHFASCGAMLDMSRGGVYTVAAVKRYIDAMAALGLNLLMLYTEDVYPVEEFPYMGYLRGRYTARELRELDDYAAESGVELVPCIQTLAHLAQFLQWEQSAGMRDTIDCLLIDDPETERFVAAELDAVRKCFRSDRIHIGMDEAHGVGLGRYFDKHGPVDRFALLNRHLTRVVGLCEKRGLKPIMWSDMFYRLGSKDNDYYDLSADIPSDAIAGIPDVAMCYWDYYHTDEDFYATMIENHQRMGKEVVFAGGNWTWSGFLPQVKRTCATMAPALRACLKRGVQTVFATEWGDDGCETDYFLALSQLPLFSEFCWLGEGCTADSVHAMGERISGLPYAAYEAFGALYPSAEDERPGKGLFYCDPLYPLTEGLWSMDGYAEGLDHALKVLEPLRSDARCEYAWLMLSIVRKKLGWVRSLRPAYIAGDARRVRELAEDALPELYALYERFLEVWRDQWEHSRKRQGWETHCVRMGGVLARLNDAQRTLLRWVNGEIERVEELDEQPLRASRYGEGYHTYALPQFRG